MDSPFLIGTQLIALLMFLQEETRGLRQRTSSVATRGHASDNNDQDNYDS